MLGVVAVIEFGNVNVYVGNFIMFRQVICGMGIPVVVVVRVMSCILEHYILDGVVVKIIKVHYLGREI